MNLRLQPLTEREELVLRLHEKDKLTYRQIGERLGVTHHRVQQILRSVRSRRKDYEENKDEALSLLPSRVTNVLGWLNPGTSRAEVRAAIETEQYLITCVELSSRLRASAEPHCADCAFISA